MDAQPAVGEPRWIEQAIAQSWEEVRLYLGTFRDVAVAPKRFAERWARGEARTLGPLGFMATSAAITGVVGNVCRDLIGVHAKQSLLAQVLEAIAPYAFYAAVGLLCHAVLRARGAVRRWSSSLAMALYAGGAMPAVAYLLCLTSLAVLAHFGKTQVEGSGAHSDSFALVLAGLVPLIWFFASLVRALAGVHGVRTRRALVAVLIPAAVITFGPSWLPVPVLHAHVAFAKHGDDYQYSLDLSDR